MEFVASFQNATVKIRTTILLSPPILLSPQAIRVRRIDATVNPSWLRLHVLRRDRYRCRCCGQKGDEVTLEVRRIQSSASNIEEMLTLCVHCRRLVEQWNIAATNSSEFLQHLRCQLGSATGTQSQTQTNKER